MTLVVTLTIRPEALASFTRFETIAAARMRAHGGALLNAVRIPPTEADARLREVHVVQFPDETAFAAYRADPELAKHQHLRAESVIATELLAGERVSGYDV